MALLQISEPGQSAAPHQHRLAVGIDLGTTNSLVASVRSGLAVTLPDDAGQHLLPSVVRYLPSGEVIVGQRALAGAARDPLNTIASVKRLMGRGIEDVKQLGGRSPYHFIAADAGMPKLATAAGEVSPVEVSAEILKVLKVRAEDALGGELQGAVITVPAYFDDAQRQATKDAATLAGLKVLRLLNEPTAAALAYGLDRGEEGVVVVYDLGGGTFDVSILRMHQGVFEVLSTGGDSALGGDDFDHLLAEWIMQQAGIRDDAAHTQLRHVLAIARAVKESLTEHEHAAIRLDQSFGADWQGQITRDQFNALIEPLLARTITSCRRALRDAGIAPGDIQQVVLVGGSTRVPRVREKVAEFFGRPPLSDIDPDKVVALGAAQQADILIGNKSGEQALLLDVIPLSLGLEVMGGLVEKIIPRNTTIPVARAQEFTTFKDGQTAMGIHVVQGERELVSDCRSLARFNLTGIPPMVAGAARICVTFQVDADGLLTVSAREETSGVASRVEVKPSYGLAENEIERMLRDSMQHAREDMEQRRLREQQVEAKRLIEGVTAALAQDSALLAEDERRRIEQAMARLEAALTQSDPAALKAATTDLEQHTAGFAARRMDHGIRQALTGHQIDEL